jgi:putative endopeptidase
MGPPQRFRLAGSGKKTQTFLKTLSHLGNVSLKRREFITLLGGCLTGLMGARSAGTQETSHAVAFREYGPWGFDLSGADFATRPGDDFFRYSNGAWFDRTVIAPDRNTNSVDTVLSDITEARIREILVRGETGTEPSARKDAEKISTFYSNFMDEARAEALDAHPIAPLIRTIRLADTRADLAELMAKTLFSSIFDLSIGIDAKAPDKYVVVIGQGKLGLPNRDYYLTAQFSDKRAAYLAYIARTLSLIGWEAPKEFAAAVLTFETAMAEASWTMTERQDPEKTYNPISVAQLAQTAPFPWRRFFRRAELGELDHLVLAEVTAIPKIGALYARTPIATLKAWQAFRLVDSAAPYLSKRFVTAHFEFHGKTLGGIAQLGARWKRGVRLVETEMGEAIGRVYLTRYFTTQAKAEIDDLVAQIRLAMKGRIERVAWINPETKSKALDKLARLKVEIGYPNKWRDYSSLEIHPSELVGNVRNARMFEWLRRVGRLNSPVDRDECEMTPQTVNADYSSNLNAIILPAAQLQAPYFDLAADPAVKYGGIGALIGHELIHGFDDDGRKYNGAGTLSNWWTNADARQFEARATELSRQYSSFEPLPGVRVNGNLTMSENIADLGGVLVALDAYHHSLGGRSAPVLDGLTGDQRFFLSYAQTFRAKKTEEETRRQLVSDPHSPEQYRVNGVVRNIDVWYQAFNVRSGDKLYLSNENRVRIW